jgi:hypothetical protein
LGKAKQGCEKKNAWLKVLYDLPDGVDPWSTGSLYAAVTDQTAEDASRENRERLTTASISSFRKQIQKNMKKDPIDVSNYAWSEQLADLRQAVILVHIATLGNYGIVVHCESGTFVVTPASTSVRKGKGTKGPRKSVNQKEQKGNFRLPTNLIHVAYDGGSHFDSVRSRADTGFGKPHSLEASLELADDGQTVIAKFPCVKKTKSRDDPQRMVLTVIEDPTEDLSKKVKFKTKAGS